MTRPAPKLRLVPLAPEVVRHGDYRDRLHRSVHYKPWLVERTEKRVGDVEMTSQGFVRHE